MVALELPSKHEAWSSNTSAIKQTNKKAKQSNANKKGWVRWLKPAILATQEAEIRAAQVKSSQKPISINATHFVIPSYMGKHK
jgi:hypothetical protein